MRTHFAQLVALVAAMLMCGCQSEQPAKADAYCGRVSCWLREKIAAEEVPSIRSAVLHHLDHNPRFRDELGGRIDAFIALLQPGDELWYYNTVDAKAPTILTSLGGDVGLAITRGGRVINTLPFYRT